MKKFGTFLLLSSFGASLFAAPLLEGTCDKNALSYKIGEKITFSVKLSDGGKPVKGMKLKYNMRGDDGKSFGGLAPSDAPLEVQTSLDKPGFVHLFVEVADESGNPIKNFCRQYNGGAAAAFDEIKPAASEPPDFDSYWQKRVSEYFSAPIKGDLERVYQDPKGNKYPENYEVYKFSIATIGDPARGYITFPKGAKEKSLKIKANFQGYGWAPPSVAIYPDAIGLSLCSHSIDVDKQKEYYEDLKRGKLKGFAWEKELASPKDSYFDGMLMRDLCAIRYAKSLPQWDGKNLEISGGSMGAFQSFAMGALDKNATKLTVYVPWMADISGKKIGRLGGWLPDPLPNRLYFDTINFAKRIKCPIYIRAGLGDYVCPPSGEAALYNSISAPVTIDFVQDATHGFPPHKTAEYRRQKNQN